MNSPPLYWQNILVQSWKLLHGWQNGTRQHYIMAVQQAMVSVHRPVHSKITVTYALTWQTDRWRVLYTPENGFRSITKCQGDLFLSVSQTFSVLIVRINCQNGVPVKHDLVYCWLCTNMPLRAWAHRRSAYTQLSPLYPLRHSHDKIYQALSRFSVLQATEGWAGPGLVHGLNSWM